MLGRSFSEVDLKVPLILALLKPEQENTNEAARSSVRANLLMYISWT
jgi:hypothetical protein